MPKTPESAQAVKYSNGGTHSIHTFRVKIHSYYSFDDGHRDEYTLDTVVYATSRAEAIGKAIITVGYSSQLRHTPAVVRRLPYLRTIRLTTESRSTGAALW